MPEVIHVDFRAGTQSLNVKLDATHTYERDGKTIVAPLTGVDMPGRHCTLGQLADEASRQGDPTLAADFLAVIARFEPVFRNWIESDIQSPDKMRVEVARIGDQRHRLIAEQDAHERGVADRHATIAQLDDEASKREHRVRALAEESKALEAKLAARRAELESMQATPSEEAPPQ